MSMGGGHKVRNRPPPPFIRHELLRSQQRDLWGFPPAIASPPSLFRLVFDSIFIVDLSYGYL